MGEVKMVVYDMPICKQHIKEMRKAVSYSMVCVAITIILAFISGYAFCKVFGG
jgi:hypothetical protein